MATTPEQTTELEVSPLELDLKVGATQTIEITTNALDFTMTSSNVKVVSVDKLKKQIKAIGKGDAQVTITAQVTGGEVVERVITCRITQSLDISFGEENEILENTYHYDETLPLSINGTVAYKRGDDEHDPLIKLVFDGKLQRWQVVGVKIVKWNTENEPFSLYFMASDGAVANKLGNMNLEQVIIDMVDELFIRETPNMQQTIRNLFDTEINPLLQTEMDKIPQYIQNEITYEIDQKINQKIEDTLEDKFGSLVETKIETKIGEFEFSRITPYHKEKKKPKWVGIIISNFTEQNKSRGLGYYSRRINTNGIEERWMNLEEARINDYSNDDELTRLFDSVEPYKSMTRMEIAYTDLKNIAGDSIYSKDIFNRLMSQSLDKNHKLFNGDFYARGAHNKQEIFNRESAWFVPLKKCHYIDIEFSLIGDDENRYMLKAVGEDEFEINLRDYFPNAVDIKTYYVVCEKVGLKEFHIDNMVIRSNLHPSFLNYYDVNCNVLEIPTELDYVYVGAFNDVKTNTTESFNGAGNLNWFLAPKPFANSYVNGLQMKQSIQQYAKYMFGMNPSVGVNFKHMEHNYMHLIWLLQTIERGSDLISFQKISGLSYKYKWSVKNYTSAYTTGHTWELGDKTGMIDDGSSRVITNYRGLEGITHCLYIYLQGIEQQNGTKNVWLHRPHSHRYVQNLWTYDGIHYIDTGMGHRNLSSHHSGDNYVNCLRHIKANCIGILESRDNRQYRHYIYTHSNNINENRQLLIFGLTNYDAYTNGKTQAIRLYYDPHNTTNNYLVSRSCI